jgi:hypothetical protein
MLEVNLGDLDDGFTGDYEVYWLLAITTAREFFRLRPNNVNHKQRRDISYYLHLLKFYFEIACDLYVTEGDSLSVVPTATLCTLV